MTRMVDVNVQPLIDGIKSKFEHLVLNIRTLKGKSGKKSEGHFLIIITCLDGQEIQIDVDVYKMLSEKHYLDTIFQDIHDIKEAMDQHAFKQRMIGY